VQESSWTPPSEIHPYIVVTYYLPSYLVLVLVSELRPLPHPYDTSNKVTKEYFPAQKQLKIEPLNRLENRDLINLCHTHASPKEHTES
jgi:hypothetical protein